MSAWVAPDPGERRKNRGWRRDRGRRAGDRGFPGRGLGHFLWPEQAKDVPLELAGAAEERALGFGHAGGVVSGNPLAEQAEK